MSTHFSVQTDAFQGPLELLLELVEKRKLFVNEVSLARVADDYVRYVENHPSLPLAQTAQFLVVASTLLLIKSRSLLPGLELTPEEEIDIKELEERLALYSKVREAAVMLTKIAGQRPLLAPKKQQPMPNMLIKPTNLFTNILASTIKSIINDFPIFVKKPEVSVETTVSLPEMIERLTKRVKREVRSRFSSVADRADSAGLIVSFLALLELVRQGVVHVRQESKFADIDIETEQMSVPSY